jgi:hypothetical protein
VIVVTLLSVTGAIADNFVPKSLGDDKGDLIGFSAADTPVKIAKASSDGSVLTSDTTQTGGVKWQYGTQFHFYQSAGSSGFAASTAWQDIAWTAEAYDSANVFTPGASAVNYTVPTTGWWLLGYEILFVSGAYGANTITFNGRVLVNGTTQALVHTTTIVGTGQPALAKSKPVYLTSGQTIKLQLARSDGFAPTTIGGDAEYTNFWGRLLATA